MRKSLNYFVAFYLGFPKFRNQLNDVDQSAFDKCITDCTTYDKKDTGPALSRIFCYSIFTYICLF